MSCPREDKLRGYAMLSGVRPCNQEGDIGYVRLNLVSWQRFRDGLSGSLD